MTSRLPSSGIVVRTSWLYSEHGQNFVKTMLRLMSEGRDVRVVSDQIGSPTSAHTLSNFIAQLIAADSAAGIYHFTDGGELSWFRVCCSDSGNRGRAWSHPCAGYSHAGYGSRLPYRSATDQHIVSLSALPKGPDLGGTPSWRAELRSVLERIKAGPSGR